MEFENKVVVITGAGPGIGKATAEAFAKAGAKLVLGDVNGKNLNEISLNLKREGSQVITVEGDSAFNNKILDLNTQLLFVGSEIEQYEFERDNLTSKAKYTSLMSFLSDLNVLPQYFKDFSSPELISVSPRDNFITQERFVRLFGYTEVNSKIVFDDEVLVSDSEGYFTKQIDLNEGLNTVRFTLKDIYGNNKLVTLTYQRKKSTLPVASYPVSGPVSYPN